MARRSPPSLWQSQLGTQRDWVWRGWRVRYTYIPAIAAEGVPIVFLHGFGAALTQWRANLQPLSMHHSIYALDLLGFGASEKASTEFRTQLWVEQVQAFCQSFIGQPVVLVGHSLGALVALTATATHPDMMQGLVLLTLPASRQEVLPRVLQPFVQSIENAFANPLLINLILQIARRPSFIRSALKQVYVNGQFVTDDLVSSFVQPAFDRGANRTLLKLVRSRTARDFSDDVRVLLQALQIPALLLWGEQDRIIPIQWGRHLKETNDHLTLVEIPNAGHCPYDEAAELVNQEILTWVERGLEAASQAGGRE